MSSENVEMDKPFFRHEYNTTVVKDKVKHVKKESVIEGTSKMTFSFLELKGTDFYRIGGVKEGDKYLVTEKKNDKEEKMELDEKKFMAMVEKNKNLKFLVDYLKKDRKKLLPKSKGGSKKGSKKTTKTVKGGSKKSSKKASKKASKKGSKLKKTVKK